MTGDDAVRIPLRDREGAVRAYAVVDAADAEAVNRWRWHLARVGYAARSEHNRGDRRMVYMHRELMGLTSDNSLEVDHIDRDRLNNRRSNLRILTHAQQLQNQSPQTNPRTSRYRGVDWHSQHRAWRARIHIAGKSRHLGLFADEAEAAEAARAARLKEFPYAVD